MKKLLIILIFFIIAYVDAERKAKDNPDFVKWRNKYKKDKWAAKGSASLEKRAARVMEKKKKCATHNAKKDVKWVCGSNEYDFLTNEEADKFLKGYKPLPRSRALPKFNTFTESDAPTDIDWSPYCKPIQNQGYCGCCWAFASMGALECFNKIKGNNGPLLSPQFLVDCDTTNAGCNGGWPVDAFNYLKSQGTTAPKWGDYPFTSGNYELNPVTYTCKNSPKIFKFGLNYTTVHKEYPSGNEAYMRALIANYGPVVAGIYAGESFLSYSGGVFWDENGVFNECDQSNHGKF